MTDNSQTKAPAQGAVDREELDKLIQRHASAYVTRGHAISDSIIAECKASREALLAAFAAQPPSAPVETEAYKCKAGCRAACNWPACECDPKANEIKRALRDDGWTAPPNSSAETAKPAGCDPCSWPECGCQHSPVPVGRAEDLWQELLEKEDRTSPEEYPEMALITLDELKEFLYRWDDRREQHAIIRSRHYARAALAAGSAPVAWRWMNTSHPQLGWSYVEQEVKESPNLLIKVQPLFTDLPQAAPLTQQEVADVIAWAKEHDLPVPLALFAHFEMSRRASSLTRPERS